MDPPVFHCSCRDETYIEKCHINGEDKFGVREQRRVGIWDRNVGFFTTDLKSSSARQIFAAKIYPMEFTRHPI